MEEKFGVEFAAFIYWYTFKRSKLNVKALEHVTCRTSFWKYREIGSNWQSKRYLTDISYIIEKAGGPSMSHRDKKIKPTINIQRRSSEIPKISKELKN